jgi:hypothetical protein
MPILLPPSPFDAAAADRRRHPAIYLEAPSSATSEPSRPTDKAFLAALSEAARGTVFFRLEQTYNARLDELSRLRSLERDWDSYGSAVPHESAISEAAKSLITLKGLQAMPDAIRPSNEGGVGVCFIEGAKYAHIEFSNNGEAFAMMYGPADDPQVWELAEPVDIAATWTRIRAYLQS